MSREGLTAFQAVNHYFEEAARIIDLDEEMHSILTSTYREIAGIAVPRRQEMMAAGHPVNAVRFPKHDRAALIIHGLRDRAPTRLMMAGWDRASRLRLRTISWRCP